METKTIKQVVTFNATPLEIYELLMDEKKHSVFTGFKVKMSKKIRGKFNIFDNYINGHNILLIEGELIVQGWHFEEDGWPENHYSICTFSFENLDTKTRLRLEQTGVPAHKVDELKEGWKQYYWEPMKKHLRTKK